MYRPSRRKRSLSIASWALVSACLSFLLPAGAQQASLETSCDRVVDGWTLRSPDFGEIRLLGVQPLEGKERTELEAKIQKGLASLVEGKRIRLEFDGPTEDAQGRLLAYVQVGQITLNGWMLRNGYARASSALLTLRHYQFFQDLQKEARENQRGVWGLSSASAAGNTPAPEKKKIIASKKSRYYYRPGQRYYDKVDLRDRIYFDSEEGAQKAGFHPYLKD